MTRRLYLDVADLFDIGDGRADASVVAKLRAAMTEAGARLLLSHDHVHDAARGGSSSLESLARGAEAFGAVLVVMAGPEAVEPLTPERPDIVVEACTNFRELIFAPVASKHIAAVAAAYDRLHMGDHTAQTTLSSKPLPSRRSRKSDELFMQCLITLCRGWMGDDAEAIFDFWSNKLDARIPYEERQGIILRLEGARGMLAAMHPLIDEHAIEIIDALRASGVWSANPTTWPGHYVALRLSGARRRDTHRRPRRSDWSDVDHAKHFPYVDIATCDANAHEIVTRVLRDMMSTRQPVILRNSRLDQIVTALRAMGPAA